MLLNFLLNGLASALNTRSYLGKFAELGNQVKFTTECPHMPDFRGTCAQVFLLK